MIDGSLDIHGYRQEIAAADTARTNEEQDVPPTVDLSVLQEQAYVIAQEAVAVYFDHATSAAERTYAAWTPATLEQAEGGTDDAS